MSLKHSFFHQVTLFVSSYVGDHDSYSGSCANHFDGTWWHMNCHCSNLNRKYYNCNNSSHVEGFIGVVDTI